MPPLRLQPALTPQEALIIASFQKRPVQNMARLQGQFHVSRMTVFRALSKQGYHRSFNHNGRFYALTGTPRFEANDLWFHRSIGFSRQGGFLDTLVALVGQLPAGATTAELSLLLRSRVANLLSLLVRQDRLARRRFGRHVVFLHHDSPQQQLQLQLRQPPPQPPLSAVCLPPFCPPSPFSPFSAN